MLPSFIVIGAAKAGTTTMFDLLGAHPDVFVSDPKEPHYFSRLTTFRAERPWYESLFDEGKGYRAVGEASTSYTHPHRIDLVAPRIQELLPDCRLIYMVRHPVKRLESDWRMRVLEGRISEDSTIEEAVDANASLVTFGFYWKHLTRYHEFFPSDQILVVFLEDLARNADRELRRAYRHIGVDPDFTPGTIDSPRNTWRDRARSQAARHFVSRIPGAQLLAALLPDWAIAAAKNMLAGAHETRREADWSRGALEEVESLFREDSRNLLRHCGKLPDFWQLENGP